MKLMHVGDLHLGRSLGDFDLAEDQEYMLKQLAEIAEKNSADGILIAGDVYDKAVPSESAMRMLDMFMSELAHRNIKVFMISGNHDSDERLHYGSGLFEKNNIFISAKYRGELYKQTLKAGDQEADIYLLPFVKASQVRRYHPDEKIESYDDAVRAVIRNADIDHDRINILVAHQFVTGSGEDPAFGGSESLGTQSVGLVEKVGYDCFDEFDYVALGHIHSPQKVGRDVVRYSGSPLKYSLSEVNNEKKAVLININGKDEVKTVEISVRPLRDVRHIRGKLRELLDKANVSGTDDYIYATLTDEEMTGDVMGIFQQVYPNTVKIDYDNTHTREIEHIDITDIMKDRPFPELVEDFYRQIYGCDISEEEMVIMREAAKEAGIIHETD